MAEELKLATNKKPTYFNKSLAIGILAGISTSVFGQPWGLTGIMSIITTGSITGGVAAIIEKNQAEQNIKYGKRISRPTFWNKDFLLSGLVGSIAGAFLEFAMPTGGIIQMSCMIGGAIAGGNAGKTKMEEEYKQAALLRQFEINKSEARNFSISKQSELCADKEQTTNNNFEVNLTNERLRKASFVNVR